MKTLVHCTQLIPLIAWLSILDAPLVAAPLGTAFTYQGKLSSGTNAANGSYDLRFSLFDALANGAQVGSSRTNAATGVTNGYFSVTLDFGAAFDGSARWLEIGVRTNSGEDFTLLSPRQPLTPTPYALYAPSAGAAANATTETSVTAGGVAHASLQPNAVLLRECNETAVEVFSGVKTQRSQAEERGGESQSEDGRCRFHLCGIVVQRQC